MDWAQRTPANEERTRMANWAHRSAHEAMLENPAWKPPPGNGWDIDNAL
jgi:hypothetical protein